MGKDIFFDLNPIQKEAVNSTEGPLLILAGAGTGKTKVLTSRIVNILQQKLAKASEILAVTFTNKAAKEMKERVELLLGYSADSFWIGTFHSIGLRILRRHYTELGLKPNFSIINTDDAEKIIKQILLDKNLDLKQYPASMISNSLSRLKDKNVLFNNVPLSEDKPVGTTTLSVVYGIYQARLQELNVVDFGDLLLLCVDLFRQFPDIVELWQQKFRYILVDEYQDTNTLQYIFIRILAAKYHNICCVGDDDQSIYSWRGAEIANILRFEKDFPGAKILRLEQNYRSTNPILKVASSLIAKNSARWDKTLWTDNEEGLKVKLFEASNGKHEAEQISRLVDTLVRKGHKYKNVAILVRATFQTREIEERLIFNRIPYKFIGGNKFFDRLEIKDAVAYLRLFNQKYDDMAYLRIINSPKRGIGESSLQKIRAYAGANKLSMFAASKDILGKKIVSAKVENELKTFLESFSHWQELAPKISLSNLTKQILEESGYLYMWETEKTQESKDRVDNLKELWNSMHNYTSLEEFLEHVSLVSDKDEEQQDNKVAVMTLHGAKGLEFDIVFLPGWEEGIFPNQRSMDETGDLALQEERRLAYVGITRAKQDLYISYANNRQMYGNWQACLPSRFIKDINPEFLEKLEHGYMGGGYSSSYELGSGPITRDNYLGREDYQEGYESSDNYYINKSPISSIKIGQRVAHPTMGLGLVESLQGPIAQVKFDSFGQKKIMISFLKHI
ncbi:UvrD-helicase domain-containing protein [Candidatus Hepatincolaceae symbiont of Richtersius coronifer]